MFFFFSDNTFERNQEATAYTANNEINFQHQEHTPLLPEEVPLPPKDYFYPATDMAGKARVSLDSPQHHKNPMFDKHHHNTYEEYNYSSFVYPLQNYPSDYSYLTAEHKYPFDGDHYHERHRTHDDATPPGKLQMSPLYCYTQSGAKQHKYQSHGNDHYHHHFINHAVSLSVHNDQMSPLIHHTNQVMKPYEYNKVYIEYNRSAFPKAVPSFAVPINVSHLLQTQEMYAPHELYMDSEKHHNYFFHTMKQLANNHPQNTYRSPPMVMDHAEPHDSSILEYKETSPIGSVATAYVPFHISSRPPKMASSQAQNDGVTSNSSVKVIGDKSRLASAPKIYLDPKRYFK
jgi:hypothetical protein